MWLVPEYMWRTQPTQWRAYVTVSSQHLGWNEQLLHMVHVGIFIGIFKQEIISHAPSPAQTNASSPPTPLVSVTTLTSFPQAK